MGMRRGEWWSWCEYFMKVLIDGYNLGLSHGTGIATYGYQLASLLNKNNHHVSCLYELSGLNHKSDEWSNFIQKLNTNKEGTTKKSGISKIGIISSIVKNYGNYLFDLPIAIKKIEKNNDIFNSLPNKIPNLSGIYNSNYVYKFSMIMNKIHGRNTLIKSGDIKYDLLHLTSPLPIRYHKIPKIVTIHDIIPIVAPDTTLANIKNYRKLIKNSISDADEIIVVSNKSKHDLLTNFDLKEEKVHVTYQSVFIPEHLKLIEENLIRMFLQNNYGLKFKEFFLFYGAIEPKKKY